MRTERIRETSFACLLVFGLKSQRRATLSHSVPGLSPSVSARKASSDALQVGGRPEKDMNEWAAILEGSQNGFHHSEPVWPENDAQPLSSITLWIAPVHKIHNNFMHFFIPIIHFCWRPVYMFFTVFRGQSNKNAGNTKLGLQRQKLVLACDKMKIN